MSKQKDCELGQSTTRQSAEPKDLGFPGPLHLGSTIPRVRESFLWEHVYVCSGVGSDLCNQYLLASSATDSISHFSFLDILYKCRICSSLIYFFLQILTLTFSFDDGVLFEVQKFKIAQINLSKYFQLSFFFFLLLLQDWQFPLDTGTYGQSFIWYLWFINTLIEYIFQLKLTLEYHKK